MSPPPRSLTFAVSTSLLTASLSLAGCDESKKAVNPGPINEAPENKGSGDAPKPETPPPTPEPTPEPPPEQIHVNEGPQLEPTAADPQLKVNPGPDGEPTPVLAPELEPKRVNTRPNEP